MVHINQHTILTLDVNKAHNKFKKNKRKQLTKTAFLFIITKLISDWIIHLPFKSNLKIDYAFLAQLDRALVYGTKGQEFESLMTHQLLYMPLFRDSHSYGVLSRRRRFFIHFIVSRARSPISFIYIGSATNLLGRTR